MSSDNQLSPRAQTFRQAINSFIDERREAKLKGLSAEKAASAEAKYEYQAWLADAARRVSQIQSVTHVLKATHPDARGSSLYVHPETLPNRAEIGSHVLGSDFADDVVGNAAALDVYKFLKIEVEGKRLLDWLQIGDRDLVAALHGDEALAQEWAESFKNLIREPESYSSHVNAKQIYWCINNDPNDDQNFHLLQPQFPSSLLHAVHQQVNDARFGEENKEARQARREKKASTKTYREYPNLALCKLGGTKPQNISQLNSERGGVNYLLSSSPPIWESDITQYYVSSNTVLNRFRKFGEANNIVNRLVSFLKSDPPDNLETRKKRERIEQALGQELASFGCYIQDAQEPGWTGNSDCKIENLHEKIWLDQERAELPVRPGYENEDMEFLEAFEWKDWPDQVASDFAKWLNDILRKQGFPVGEVEFKHWAKQAVEDAAWPAKVSRKAFVIEEEKTHA